jgi:hypothetical protein
MANAQTGDDYIDSVTVSLNKHMDQLGFIVTNIIEHADSINPSDSMASATLYLLASPISSTVMALSNIQKYMLLLHFCKQDLSFNIIADAIAHNYMSIALNDDVLTTASKLNTPSKIGPFIQVAMMKSKVIEAEIEELVVYLQERKSK